MMISGGRNMKGKMARLGAQDKRFKAGQQQPGKPPRNKLRGGFSFPVTVPRVLSVDVGAYPTTTREFLTGGMKKEKKKNFPAIHPKGRRVHRNITGTFGALRIGRPITIRLLLLGI